MHYLVDGHNLIGQMPDIDLDDPHDELHLVLRLRAWAAADRRRLVTVIFDGGLPGGVSRDLSSGPVQVIFASAGRTADGRLIRIIESVANPPEFTLVTNDRRIIDVATARRLPHMPARRFARELTTRRSDPSPPAGDDPVVSDAEVAEWLELFGPVPERPRPAPPPRRPKTPPKPPPAGGPLVTAKDEDRALDDAEVEAWLALFGGEPAAKAPETPPARPRARRRPSGQRPADSSLSDADWAAWNEFVGDEEDR